MDFYSSTTSLGLRSLDTFFMKQIDLNNYYIKYGEDIRCQICACNFSKDHIFEHTISKRHKYNKLFVATLQDCSSNSDLDFRVLNIDRLQCRYCDGLVIDSNIDDLVISHIQNTKHITRRESFLDEISASSSIFSMLQSELLQPLDSLITHNKDFTRRMIQSRKKNNLNENILGKVKLGIESPKDTDNIDQNNSLYHLEFSRAYERERGEKLPKFITISDNTKCTCTICFIEIPKSTYNVGGHINGKKHRNKVLKSEKCPDQELEIINVNARSSPEPAKLSFHKIDEIVKYFEDRNNIRPHCSTLFGENKTQSKKESSDCIGIGENGTRMCTICVTPIPNTVYNINQHLEGGKHRQTLLKLQEPKQKELKLQATNKSTPMPIINVKSGSYMCMTCWVMVPNGANCREKHENGRSHTKKFLQLMKSTKSELQTTKKSIPMNNTHNIMCTTCNILISSDERNVELHNKGKKHRKELLKSIKTTKKLKSQDTNESVPAPAGKAKDSTHMCTTCNIFISSNERNVELHNKGKKHQKELLKSISITKGLKSQHTNKSISAPTGTAKNSIHMCTICNVPISSNERNVKKHNDGRKHRNKLR